MSLPDQLIVLANIEDEDADTFDLLYFVRDGEPYIPVFSSWEALGEQTENTPYAHQGLGIDAKFLGALLESDYPVILDPLTMGARLVDKNELLGITP